MNVVSLLGFLRLGLEFSWNALLGKGVYLGSFLSFLLDQKRHLDLEARYCIDYHLQTKPSRYRILFYRARPNQRITSIHTTLCSLHLLL